MAVIIIVTKVYFQVLLQFEKEYGRNDVRNSMRKIKENPIAQINETRRLDA